MTTIQPTTSVTISDTTYEVKDLSSEAQYLVTLIDSSRQDEVNNAETLLKTRAALVEFQNRLIQQIQTDNAPSEEASQPVL